MAAVLLRDIGQSQRNRTSPPLCLESSASVPGVVRIEKCHARKSGLGVLVEIHVEVESELTVRRGHETGHDLSDKLKSSSQSIQLVVVHVEPALVIGGDSRASAVPQKQDDDLQRPPHRVPAFAPDLNLRSLRETRGPATIIGPPMSPTCAFAQLWRDALGRE